jgi:hypothetical protein
VAPAEQTYAKSGHAMQQAETSISRTLFPIMNANTMFPKLFQAITQLKNIPMTAIYGSGYVKLAFFQLWRQVRIT